MGKTSKPLRLLVHPEIAALPEFEELRAKGHTVLVMDDVWAESLRLTDFDAILGPTTWRMTPAHIKYLPLAVEEARKARYPKEQKP